jgi:hypothetical protein
MKGGNRKNAQKEREMQRITRRKKGEEGERKRGRKKNKYLMEEVKSEG